ncbi:hypothetical protein HDU97_007120 [Phlyctochytrium planicorne]|nr:hypothetical protein HDU97_007120 [Phlyctochytrium planicorne]
MGVAVESVSAQYSSWTVSKDFTYYTKIVGNTIGYIDNNNKVDRTITGTASNLALFGNGLSAVGVDSNFFTLDLPLRNASDPNIWKPLAGNSITKASGNKDGELWLITSLLRLHKVVFTQWGFPRDETVDGRVLDLHIRDQIYIVTINKTVCWRGFAQNPIYECNAPSFTPSLIAAGDSHVYVMSTSGKLYAASKPLSADSKFLDTGFSSQGARLLSMPLDYDNVYILDSSGAPVENICSSPSVNCKPSASLPTAPSQTQPSVPTLAPTAAADSSSSSGLSTGALAGIGVGAVLIIAAVIGAFIFVRVRRSPAMQKVVPPSDSGVVREPFYVNPSIQPQQQPFQQQYDGDYGQQNAYNMASVPTAFSYSEKEKEVVVPANIQYQQPVPVSQQQQQQPPYQPQQQQLPYQPQTDYTTQSAPLVPPVRSVNPQLVAPASTVRTYDPQAGGDNKGLLASYDVGAVSSQEAPPIYREPTSFQAPSWDQKH